MSPTEAARAPLGPHLFEILLVLADGPAHGYGIVTTVRERTGGRVVLPTSTLYRGVERLLAGGLIADCDEPEAEASGGPPRRFYQITKLGRQTAEAEAQRLREVMLLAESRFLSPRPSR